MNDKDDKHHLISSSASFTPTSPSTTDDYNPVHHPDEEKSGIKKWFNKHKPELHHISEDKQHIPGPVPASTSNAVGNDTTLHGALMKTERMGREDKEQREKVERQEGGGGEGKGGEEERKYKHDPRKICPPGTNWTTFLKF